MMDELAVLKVVVNRLESASICYMITGSIAANFYATPRLTRDIDIVIDVEGNEADKLFSLFSKDFYVEIGLIKNALQDRQMFNIIHNEAIVKVDFIIRKDDEYRRIEFGRRRSIDFEGLRIDITSPEDLILSKLSWAKDSFSEMQIRDAKNLMKTVPDLDMDYIKEWVPRLGLQEIYKKVQENA